MGSESISDTCNIHSGCFILWKLKHTHSPHSYVIQRVPIHYTYRNYIYKFPTLPEVTSIDYKFSNRKWFQSQMYPPISATLLLTIQVHEHALLKLSHTPAQCSLTLFTLLLMERDSPLIGYWQLIMKTLYYHSVSEQSYIHEITWAKFCCVAVLYGIS